MCAMCRRRDNVDHSISSSLATRQISSRCCSAVSHTVVWFRVPQLLRMVCASGGRLNGRGFSFSRNTSVMYGEPRDAEPPVSGPRARLAAGDSKRGLLLSPRFPFGFRDRDCFGDCSPDIGDKVLRAPFRVSESKGSCAQLSINESKSFRVDSVCKH